MQTFLNSFKSFINSAGRSVLFTILFYSLWLVISCVSSQSFELHAFPNRMIGIATLEAYDVGARVSLFYKAIALLVFSFPVFNLAAYFIFKKNAALFSSAEVKIINYTSVAGAILFLFGVFGYKVSETLEIIYFIHKLMLAGILLKLFLFKKNVISIYQHSFLISVSLSLYFFICDCFNLSGALKNPDVYIVTFIIACLALIAFNVYLKKKTNPNALLYSLLPLTFLPCISILKDEVFLILQRNDLPLSSPLFIFVTLIILMIVMITNRYKRSTHITLPSEKEIIGKFYFPIMIFSLISYTFYSVYQEYSYELFEYGNVYLPIMEYKLFGVIPTFEKLNSHLISDYFFSAIYTLFNGMAGRELQLYDFFIASMNYTLYYYLVFHLSRNAFVALFTVLLFPFAPFLMPAAFCFCVLAIFSLNHVIQSPPSLKKYIGFFAAVVGLVFWRIDIGYTCMVVMPLMLLFYHFTGSRFKINWLLFVKAFALVVGAMLAFVTVLCLYRGANLFSKVPYALNYFSSAQTYGYTDVGWHNDAYKMHYFVFPVLVGLLFIALLVKFKSLNISKGQRIAYLVMLFSCAFYFINFNRGLIRHSLVEGTDTFTSTYIYITLPAAVFLFPGTRARITNYILFSLLAFFMVIKYRVNVPDAIEGKSLFESLVEKTKATEKIDLTSVTTRVIPDPVKEQKFKPFTDFIAQNTSSEQTFIDFTNNPMLFYFTKKVTPSYFYQNPGCTHNEFLQKKFISDLKDYDTPYLVFASMDSRGFDHVDEVPNPLRHYRLSEYFYTHYAPYIIAGSYCLWKRNDVIDHNKKEVVYAYRKTTDSTHSEKKLFARIKFKPGKKYLAKIITTKKTELEFTVSSRGAVSPLIAYNSDTLAYSVIEASNDYEAVLKNNHRQVKEFLIIECDHIPDYYSEKFLSYNYRKLPFIWGTYDKTVRQEPVLFEDTRETLLESNAVYSIDLPAKLDKTTGNTVLVTCRNTSKKTQRLHLFFGNSHEQRTIIGFDVLPSDTFETHAIRVSSIYKWYNKNVNKAGLFPGEDKIILVKTVKITKGN